MKKYIYTKGTEVITVETDGFKAINNFMVTGVLGAKKIGSELVRAGLNFKMGDAVTIPMMLNIAKKCECKVECYDCGKYIAEESADYTAVEPEVPATEAMQELFNAGGEVAMTETLALTAGLAVEAEKEVVLDMAGNAITAENPVWGTDATQSGLINVNGGKLTIKGNGLVQAIKDDSYAVAVTGGGTLVIEDGTFNGNISSIYVKEGYCEILGGTFDIQQLDEAKGKAFTLNCFDENYKNGKAQIVVKGGTFIGFNPAANAAETQDETTNYVAEGYTVVEDGDRYTVVMA